MLTFLAATYICVAIFTALVLMWAYSYACKDSSTREFHYIVLSIFVWPVFWYFVLTGKRWRKK